MIVVIISLCWCKFTSEKHRCYSIPHLWVAMSKVCHLVETERAQVHCLFPRIYATSDVSSSPVGEF